MSLHIAAKKGQIAESILLPGDPLRAKFGQQGGSGKFNLVRLHG